MSRKARIEGLSKLQTIWGESGAELPVSTGQKGGGQVTTRNGGGPGRLKARKPWRLLLGLKNIRTEGVQ